MALKSTIHERLPGSLQPRETGDQSATSSTIPQDLVSELNDGQVIVKPNTGSLTSPASGKAGPSDVFGTGFTVFKSPGISTSKSSIISIEPGVYTSSGNVAPTIEGKPASSGEPAGSAGPVSYSATASTNEDSTKSSTSAAPTVEAKPAGPEEPVGSPGPISYSATAPINEDSTRSSASVLKSSSNTDTASSSPAVASSSPSKGFDGHTTRSTKALGPIITIGSQIITAKPSGFTIIPSSAQSSEDLTIIASPGGSQVNIGSDVLSLGTSGDLVIDSSTVALGSPLGDSPILGDQSSAPQISATVVTSVVGSSTIIDTFMQTKFPSLTAISEPQTTSTAILVGSTTSIVSMVIGPGGVAWNIPSQISNGPLILPPSIIPVAQMNPSTSSTTSGPPPLTAQVSTTSVSSSDLPVQGAQLTSENKDSEWLTEAPLTTATKTTSPVLISTITTGITEDGHSEHDGHPLPVFWHPHCLLFCGGGCSLCGIAINLDPGIYPPAIIDPPSGWKGGSLPTITVHHDGTPEYKSEDGSMSQSTKPTTSATTSSTTSGTSSSAIPTETPKTYPYGGAATLESNDLMKLATALDLEWSSELKANGLFMIGSMTSTGSSTTPMSPSVATPSAPPPFPSPSCLPAAEGGFSVSNAVTAIGTFCTTNSQVVGPGSPPASMGGIDDGHYTAKIRLTLSWHDTGNCPPHQSPNQNDGRDCNTIFHNIISGCPNDPSEQNGGSISWNCGYWYLGFDTGQPDVAPPRSSSAAAP